MFQQIRYFSLAVACYFVSGTLLSRGDSILYDLDSNGPETSFVQECIAEGNCFDYPVNGHIEVVLNEEAPQLVNIDSNILVPPDVYGPISPEVWDHLDLLVGEYLSTDNQGHIAMLFRPISLDVMRAYELRVDLTGNLQALSITGGIEQDAASPMEPDVRFHIDGVRLQGSVDVSDSDVTVPEPHAVLLALVALPWFIASRRRR